MELIFSLEESYGVQFDESEFMSLTSPAAIWSAVQKHLAT
jgi:acyl carrier protein